MKHSCESKEMSDQRQNNPPPVSAGDRFVGAYASDEKIYLGAALATETCMAAQQAHTLSPLSSIALGRLLSSLALFSKMQRRRELCSIQLICNGPIKQLFADITEQGHLRGYCRAPHLFLPQLHVWAPDARSSIGTAVGNGTLSVIRVGVNDQYEQSATHLRTGEIDEDIEYFLQQSDQVATTLMADVKLNEQGKVCWAGGVFVQALPDSDPDAFEAILNRINAPEIIEILRQDEGSPESWLQHISQASSITETMPLRWQCRCSLHRARSAVELLSEDDLQDMVQKDETAKITCEFCSAFYEVSVSELEQVLKAKRDDASP